MPPIMINDVPVSCINQAAVVYHVPAPVILVVLKAENGRNGDARHNKNGTIDYGVAQINSLWLPKISAYGYTKDDLQFNPCKNIEVATWIISQGMATGKSVWSGIANYHSMTHFYNKQYQKTIYINYKKLANIISAKKT